MTRRTVLVAACLALGSLVAGCGVGAQSQPETVDRADVPFGLVEHERSTPTTAPQVGVSYTLFFVADDRLRAVTRSATTTLGPTAVLRRLVRGPDRDGSAEGLRTALPPDLTIERVAVHDRIATVTLGGSGSANASDQQPLGVAQLVFSATGLAGVDRVRFEVDGKPAEIPRGDGTLSTAPVGRDDYPTVAP